MVLKMGQSAPSLSLCTIPNCKEGLIDHRVLLPFRGTWKDCRNRPTGASWSSAWADAKSPVSGEERPHGPAPALQKRTCWTLSWTWAISTLGWIRKIIAGQGSFCSTQSWWGHTLEYCIHVWAPQYERDMGLLEQILQKATKIIVRLGHLLYKEKLRSLRRFGSVGDLLMNINILWETLTKSPFLVSCERTRGSGLKLKYREFHLNIRRGGGGGCCVGFVLWFFLTAGVTKNWNRLFQIGCYVPIVEISKPQLDNVLDNLL